MKFRLFAPLGDEGSAGGGGVSSDVGSTGMDSGSGSGAGLDVDALIASVESGESDRAGAVTEPPKAQPAQPAPMSEIEFTWNGKPIKAPLDRAKQWAAQGYDYAQKMQEFNQQRQTFEEQQKAIREIESRYKPVEDYISQNPDWWNHVQQAYQAAQTGLDPNNPLAQKYQALESKLGAVDQFIQSIQAKEQNQKLQEQDQQLNQEIQSIRDSYKDLDWSSVNAEGKTLEYQVLEHANKTGIQSFRAAFRDFYHDQLLKIAEERGKESLVKERQKQTKLGLLGESSTPKKGIQSAQDLKNKSYDELEREALEELGIA